MIRYAIQYMIWHNSFHNTFAILSWESEICDPGLWSGALCTRYNYCLHSNDVQWLQKWWHPWSFQMLCVCAEFAHFIGINWLLFVISPVHFYFGMCYNCTISHPYFLIVYRNTYRSLHIGSIPTYQCIVSALYATLTLNELKNKFKCITWINQNW